MGKRPGLSENKRQRAIGMLTAGCSQRDVAQEFNVHPSTICRLWNRFRTTGNVSDRQRSGRPRKTTVRQDRFIVTTSRRNRFMAAPRVAEELHRATGVRLCGQSVRNRLRSANLRARRPLTAVPLTQRHRQTRIAWANTHRRWIQRQWNEVLFTDESRFNVDFADGRLRVWRRRNERFDPENIIQRDRYGGGSVMVWGGISHRGKTVLVVVNGTLNSQRYCDEIVVPVVVPFLRQGNARILQQDNARPHTARHTQTTLQQNNIVTLDWPARSPDLSPIEHVWDILGRHLRQRHNVNNVAELVIALQHEWNQISVQEVRNLIRSMRRRCMAVIAANGGHTKY